jgi:hypothetical protein
MGVLLPLLLVSALLAQPQASAQGPASPGVRTLDDKPVDPWSVPAGTRGHVLVFTTTDCPISNRYAPELARLSAAYAARGIRFWMVYPVPGDTPERIRAHVGRFGIGLPVVRDTLGTLVRRSGVTVTPEVAVIHASGQLVYRGRVDDRYTDFGVDRPAPRTRDLDQALTQLLAGQPVVPATTRAVGCFLPDLLK